MGKVESVCSVNDIAPEGRNSMKPVHKSARVECGEFSPLFVRGKHSGEH